MPRLMIDLDSAELARLAQLDRLGALALEPDSRMAVLGCIRVCQLTLDDAQRIRRYAERCAGVAGVLQRSDVPESRRLGTRLAKVAGAVLGMFAAALPDGVVAELDRYELARALVPFIDAPWELQAVPGAEPVRTWVCVAGIAAKLHAEEVFAGASMRLQRDPYADPVPETCMRAPDTAAPPQRPAAAPLALVHEFVQVHVDGAGRHRVWLESDHG